MLRFSALLFFSVFLITFSSKSQSFHIDRNINGFSKVDTIKVFNKSDLIMNYGFVGGMNSCQFNEIDLNLDRINDLLVFDRHGNRVMTFIADVSQKKYLYKPEYEKFIPEINHWIRCEDYNNDGKKDIFTYTIGGIKVFKNVSDDKLKFQQVTNPYLTSNYGSVATNILVTNVDFPAIVDIDGDGDLDILTFWGLGSFIDLHKNLSIEKYGNADSLIFAKTSGCWGNFAEGSEDNNIILDTCINSREFHSRNAFSDEKHTGSTLLVSDFDRDGIRDLLLGDVDYPTLIFLKNSGTDSDAFMSSYTHEFPPNSENIFLNSFPVSQLIDIDFDGTKDLIVSPFDPSLFKSENKNSNWVYLNKNTDEKPDYQLNTKSFLQNEMLDFGSGANPMFFDYNNDGLLDLLVGNFGYYDSSNFNPQQGFKSYYHSQVALLLNIGSKSNPVFKITDTNFLNLSKLNKLSLFPAFADIEGDGDLDLFFGESNGSIIFCENISTNSGNPVFAEPVINWKNINVGKFSAPFFVDINDDGLIDFISGNQNGRLSYYKNIGTKQVAEYELISDFFCEIEVTNYQISNHGYNTPFIYKNSQNNFVIFCGAEDGNIYVYDQIDVAQNTSRLLGVLPNVKEGIRTATTFGNLNNDGYLDMVVGNFAGGLATYLGNSSEPFEIEIFTSDNKMVEIYPNPTSGIIKIKSLSVEVADIQIFDLNGHEIITMKNENLPTQINLSSFPKSVYTIVLKTKDFVYRNKVIIL